jgi:hypothetical protein
VNKVIRLIFVHTRLYMLARPIFFPRGKEHGVVSARMSHGISRVVEETNRETIMEGGSEDEAKRTHMPMHIPKYGCPGGM